MLKNKKIKKEVSEEVSQETKVDNLVFNIYDVYGKYVRTYSTEFHGEGAESLAKGFALKINGSIK